MKLHQTTVERILSLIETYNGSPNQEKLKKQLAALDLTPYEQKLGTGGNIVLVTTEDYELALRNTKK